MHLNLSMALPLCALALLNASHAGEIDFNREIRPILSENCFQCHGPDAAERQGDLRLDTEAGAQAALVPGRPEASTLISRIVHADPEERMPPADSQRSLTATEISLLKVWVTQGAPWAEHWAFVSPLKAPLPAKPPGNDWGRHAIDRFVLERLRKKGLEPSPEASKATLIRRLSLDLTGLPPSPAEVDAFVQDDSPEGYDRLVTRLFHSPRYGEHLAWQWLEAARYADTDGYQNDGPREMWRWRDWVIDAYNRNLPFDQFTIEQLAGDLLPNPTLEQRIATGFNRNHRYNSESGLVLEEFLLENAVDRVDTTSTVWMGMTAGCARCHDHKYDPISQKEYYRLIAYFNNVPESGRAIKFGNSEPWIKAPTRAQQARLNELTQSLDAAQKALAKTEPNIAAAQAHWETQPSLEQTLLKKGLVFHQPEQSASPEQLKEKIPGLICNGRFSIAFHLTPADVQDGAILSTESPGNERQGILVSLTEGRLRFQIITRWIAGVATVETEPMLLPDEPVHVVVTNDGTQRAQGMKIYLNGKAQTTRILHNTNSNKSAETFGVAPRIGTSPHAPPYRGTVRDLRIYTKRTLTESQATLLAEPLRLSEIVALAPQERSPSQRLVLRHYFLEHAAEDKIQELAKTYQAARETLLAYEDQLPTSMVMKESPRPRVTHLRERGIYDAKGEVVQRGTPEVFPAMPTHFPKNRLGLAQWLVSDKHPLTARVTVNRHWQRLFGRGLVKTAEDFGAQGSQPSHPALLDWLAVDFMEHGWDVQHLLRRIVSSATYRQSSQITKAHRLKDPENVFLARAPRRRLPGNILRDQALLAGGLLVEKQGGPSVKPYQPTKLWREASNFSYQVGKGSDLYRRSLYTYWKRTLAPPSMAVLDTADRESCSVNLKKTNTPLQALTLLNETAFFETARQLAQRMLEHSADPKAQIEFGFRTVTSRYPSSEEAEILSKALASYRAKFEADPKSAQKTLAVGRSKHPEDVDMISLASAAALANVLLNLDETTVRE